MEWLGNVGRRKLDNDLLVASSLVATPTLLGLVDALEQGLSQLDVVQEEVDKGSISLGQGNVIAGRKLYEKNERRIGCQSQIHQREHDKKKGSLLSIQN